VSEKELIIEQLVSVRDEKDSELEKRDQALKKFQEVVAEKDRLIEQLITVRDEKDSELEKRDQALKTLQEGNIKKKNYRRNSLFIKRKK
jgi:hypothetical protein